MATERSFSERFELKSQAGTGGMGTVYQAFDRDTGALVALKVLQARGVTDAARFHQEATLLHELRHPGIVRFVDHGVTTNGDPFIAMEWLEGETLERRLLRGPLPARAVALLGQRVLEALAAAHAKGVVHRDIKPSNIYLVGWRLDDIRILDFGIARRVFDPRRFTRVGSMVGTPLYTAPEQARGSRDIDSRADVFSLGCVLFEAMTGTPPFKGDTPQDVMAMICTGQAPDIRSRCPGIDPELGALMQSLLIQEKSRRPGDANALAAGFARVVGRLGSAHDFELPAAVPALRELLGEDERRVVVALRLRFDDFSLPNEALRQRRTDRRIKARELLSSVAVRLDRLLDESLVITATELRTPTDQAELLARAAVLLRDGLPEASIGIAMGRASLLEQTPVGPLVDRLMALPHGERGGIVLDPAVARLLRGRFSMWEERRSIFLLTPSERTGVTYTAHAPEPELLGRDRELRALGALCSESAEEAVARAALVVAGTGLGKTRLRRELRARLSADVPDASVLSLRVRRVQAGLPGGYVRALFEAFPHAGEVLNVAATEQRLNAFLEARLAIGPVVLLADDLHEADQASAAILDAALRAFSHKPLTVVGFARPEVDEFLPGLWKGRNVERVRLPPLSRKVGQALVSAWLPSTSPEIEEFLLERWDGNPFFLRELTSALLEGETELPDSVLGATETRLSVVGEDLRRVLRAASVFGETCSREGLEALLGHPAPAELDAQLDALCDRELLREVPGSTGLFQLPSLLLREACFQMLTPSDRAIAVRLARRFLESLDKTLPHFLLEPPPRLVETGQH